jgi:hypothetical protein
MLVTDICIGVFNHCIEFNIYISISSFSIFFLCKPYNRTQSIPSQIVSNGCSNVIG